MYKTTRQRLQAMLPKDQRDKLAELEIKHDKAAHVYKRRGVNYAVCNGETIALETVGQRAMRFADAGITGPHATTKLHLEDRPDVTPFLEWAATEYKRAAA